MLKLSQDVITKYFEADNYPKDESRIRLMYRYGNVLFLMSILVSAIVIFCTIYLSGIKEGIDNPTNLAASSLFALAGAIPFGYIFFLCLYKTIETVANIANKQRFSK